MIKDKTHLCTNDEFHFACGAKGQGTHDVNAVDCPNCKRTKLYYKLKNPKWQQEWINTIKNKI
jgi:hypothetical protein